MKMENAKAEFVIFDSADVIATSTSGEGGDTVLGWWGYEGDLKKLMGMQSGIEVSFDKEPGGWSGDEGKQWAFVSAHNNVGDTKRTFDLGDYTDEDHQVNNESTLWEAFAWLNSIGAVQTDLQ